jgi:hypothetical protein
MKRVLFLLLCAGCAQKPIPAADVTVAVGSDQCDGSGIVGKSPQTGTCPFDFGTVPSSTGAQQTFTLANSGNAAADVTATLSGDPAFTVVSVTTPVAPGGSGTVVISVLPQLAKQVASALVISAQPPETDIHLDLTATGDGNLPVLSPNPSSCDFGSLAVGQSGQCALSLSNTGNASLHITSVSFADNPGGIFSIVGPPPANVDVAAGSASAITIACKPNQPGDTAGHLLVVSNDPTDAQARIQLTVHGT